MRLTFSILSHQYWIFFPSLPRESTMVKAFSAKKLPGALTRLEDLCSSLKLAWDSECRSVFLNSFFLVGNTIVNSGIGFLFWMIATRIYFPAEVGIGAAYVNVITLIAMLGDMGLGIVMIRYLVGLGVRQQSFITSSALSVTLFALLFSVLFMIGIPL